MKVDEAIAALRAMDLSSQEPFSAAEHEALVTLGTAAWSGDLQLDDPRILGLPGELPAMIEDLVRIMRTKRIVQ
jgi:hypothetical protein